MWILRRGMNLAGMVISTSVWYSNRERSCIARVIPVVNVVKLVGVVTLSESDLFMDLTITSLDNAFILLGYRCCPILLCSG